MLERCLNKTTLSRLNDYIYIYIYIIKIKRMEHGSSSFEIVPLNEYTRRSDYRISLKLKPLGTSWKNLSNDIYYVKIQRLDSEKCKNQNWLNAAP